MKITTLFLMSLALCSCGGQAPISPEQVGDLGRIVAEIVINANSGK